MLDLLARLVDSLPMGVIVLDAEGRAVIYNRVEERLAGRRREDVLGTDFFRVHGYCMDVPHLAGQFRERIGRQPLFAEADFSFPFPFLSTPREVRVQLSSFEAEGTKFGLLLIRDVSHERAVDKMRETLSQMLVHDIRNPLTTVIANLQFLEAAVRDVRDAREALEDGIAAAHRIETMLENLLDTTRLETDDLPLAIVPVDLVGLADRAVELTRGVARLHEAQLQREDGPEPVVAEVDGEIVLRIFENLIDNAVRHARKVSVSVSSSEDSAVLQIVDDGPGVPAEARARIFEKYAQVEVGGGHRRARNRGLGLTFVRLAARAHGGDASVSCPPEGGSVFRVRLPLVSPVSRRFPR